MKKASYQPGEFCWADLQTTDIDRAKSFYGQLFGWAMATNPDGSYTLASLDGDAVAAVLPLPPGQAGIPPHWNVYVAVASADEAAARVPKLGGTVILPPGDVGEFGRLTVVADPTGGVLGLWEVKQFPGAGRCAERHTVGWCELWTKDPARAAEFYAGLLGWGVHVSPDYTEWTLGEQHIGGMLRIDPSWGDMPTVWGIYISVDDCDATVARITELGGACHMPPRDVEKVGRFAVVADPSGAAFCVIALAAG